MARSSDELVFAPLGGVGEIGMNLALYGFGDERRDAFERIFRQYEREVQDDLLLAEDGSFDAIALQSKATAARLTCEWLQGCRRSLRKSSKDESA